MNDLDALVRDYRVALLRYLPRRDEAALTTGYEIGRAAVAGDLSLLHLVHVHHTVLLEVLVDARPEELADVAAAAAELLTEALAPFHLAQRASPREPDAAEPTT